MTDMYDSECDEEYDEYFNRHQRRLSDPSSNLNNFSKNGWKTKNSCGNSKALSQNEGLDSLANEMSEIEAGNVRDGKIACFVLHFHLDCIIFSKFNIFGQMVMVKSCRTVKVC